MSAKNVWSVGAMFLAMLIWGSNVTIVLAQGDHEGHDHHGKEEAGHSHEAAEAHGGCVTMTKEFHIEVAFHADGVNVFAYDDDQKPISTKGFTGKVSVEFKDKARKAAAGDLAYAKGATDKDQDSLHAKLDLAKLGDGECKATIHLSGLPGKAEKDLDIAQAFKLARVIKAGKDGKAEKGYFGCSMHPEVASEKDGDTCWKCNMKLAWMEDKEEGEEEHGEHEKGEHHDDGHHHK